MKSCVLLAIAGIASGALGQVATLDMVADGVWDGDNRMTLSVFVDSDYSRPGFSATNVVMAQFSLVAIGENSTVEDVTMIEGPGWEQNQFLSMTDAGYDGEGGHGGFAVHHNTAFFPWFRPDELSSFEDGPVFLASFEMTLSEPITLDTELGWEFGEYWEYGLYPYTLTLFDINANPNAIPGEEEFVSASDIEFGSFYIPSPSGLAILGLGGLFAGRRRRDSLERSSI